jgi:hypothetical protein
MNRKKRRTSKETIRRVGEIIEEFLIGNFESEFSVGATLARLPGAVEPEVQVEGQPGEPAREAVEPEREDVDEEAIDEEAEAEQYDETKFYFDLADVEYCVDVTITEIISEKLVTGYDDPRKPPTLSEIFQMLFGEEDSLTKQVDEFEELISGYDDHVHIDDLQQAHNVMSEIVEELKDRSKN